MFQKMTISDINVEGKKVFCRVDFNVPLDDEGRITDDTRIQAALPSLRHLIGQGARLILASHLGRPKGEPDPRYSLKPVAAHLSALLGQPVAMAPDCVGAEVEQLVSNLGNGDVLLLENVRFHAGETKNDEQLSRKMAALADVYVNDAFGTAHRAHASTEGVARILKPAVAGFLMEKELKYLGQALEAPRRPFVAVIGGAKVSDKITVIENLLEKVDILMIGGGMAYTFLRAQGVRTGKSLVEEDRIELAKELLSKAAAKGVELLLPKDHLAAESFGAAAEAVTCEGREIPGDLMALDIGPKSADLYEATLRKAATVVWNGPMGVFEFPAFAGGTLAIARALAESGCLSIVGGGDSVAAVNQCGLQDRMTHVSTGGGASLELLEGKVLPGVAILSDK